MKVYFEESGFCGLGNGVTLISIKVYVDPTNDGHAYHFHASGKKYMFAWAHPERARCFDSSELPENLWYSITHGMDRVAVLEEKKDTWNFEDLIFHEVDKESIESYNEASERVKSVNSIEEFKTIIPLIIKGKRANGYMIAKLFGFFGIKRAEMVNGELGMALFEDNNIFWGLIEKLQKGTV